MPERLKEASVGPVEPKGKKLPRGQRSKFLRELGEANGTGLVHRAWW